MYNIKEFIITGKKLLKFDIQIQKRSSQKINKLFFKFQPIIYFYKVGDKVYPYGGNIDYLKILFNKDNYTVEIKKILLKKTIFCSIILVTDYESEKYFNKLRELYIRGEEIKMSSNLIESIKDEDISYSNDDLYNISSWGADLSFRELVFMYDDGELLKPELQRKYVWSKNEASRFIDSILLGLPVPSIFLAKEKDEKKLIVDGYQRIMTVYDFIKGEFSDTKKTFRLSNNEIINEKWRGKSFDELSDDEKRRIRSTTIHAIIFEQKYPKNDTGMYQVFERINTSGKVLKPQEIRNCVYQGNFNTLLFLLNKDENWRKILNKPEDSRMYDLELILRFFAIRNLQEEKHDIKQINLLKYLNEYMGKYRNIDENESNKMKEDFQKITKLFNEELGKNSFRNYSLTNHAFSTKINPAIFDALCVSADKAIKTNKKIENLQGKYRKLLANKEFITATTQRTTNIENINKRIKLASEILFGETYD